MEALNLEIDHQQLSNSLTCFAQSSAENAARLESYQVELDYITNNKLSVSQYLSDLKNHESDVVLLRHAKPSAWRALSKILSS